MTGAQAWILGTQGQNVTGTREGERGPCTELHTYTQRAILLLTLLSAKKHEVKPCVFFFFFPSFFCDHGRCTW